MATKRDSKWEVTWDEFHIGAKSLSEKIIESQNPIDTILAISRGGLTLAHVLSVKLGIRNVHTICMSSYEGRTRKKLRIESKVPTSLLSENTLVVDDLLDSGQSIEQVHIEYPTINFSYAVLYNKSIYSKFPKLSINYTYKFIDKNIWVVFPWEK